MVRKLIKEYRHLLTRQQVTTLNGQIKADNEEGALKQYADQRYRKYYRNNE